jgi:hypothetical protein
MSKGILIFAFNNDEIDYVKLAGFSASRAKKFLKVPVSIVTDEKSSLLIECSVFDKIIVDESKSYTRRTFRDGDSEISKTIWKNTHRSSAYDLTPYDETLVIDVDYIVNSSLLSYCWNQPNDFLIYKNSLDISQWRGTPKHVSDYGIPFYWATVFYFKKTAEVKALFSIVENIKNNWQYYKFLYQIDSAIFRNDHAFSIAIHMLNGFSDGDFAKALPGKLFYSLDRDYLVKNKERDFYFLIQDKKNQHFPLKVSNLDLHIMNKYSLLRIIDGQ